MSEPTEGLSEQARAVIAEEEALLARVHSAIQAARVRAGARQDRGALLERLTELRDAASTAVESDLPALFQEMDNTRTLFEREAATALPEPHTPYFAHLRLKRHEGPSHEYLLGRTTFTDSSAGVRIIDWRFAPVARVFYGYEEGDDYEEYFGDRLSEGVVEARRLVVIERGVLTRISAGEIHLERTPTEPGTRSAAPPCSPAERERPCVPEAWAWAWARPGARHGSMSPRSSMPNSSQALQAEADQPLLVLGSAGSGKTTVALHRLAKITFDLRAASTPSKMKVIVPEEGLARLSRRLLAPLELRNVSVETLDAWAYATACTAFGVKSIALSPDKPAAHLAAQAPPGAAARAGAPARQAEADGSVPEAPAQAARGAAHRPHAAGRGGGRLERRSAHHGHRGHGAAHDAPDRHAARPGVQGL